MVIPTQPIVNFIVGQTDFALASLDGVFDSMLRLGPARQFGKFRFGGSIAEKTVVFDRSLVVASADDNQHFVRANATSIRLGLHAAFDDLDLQGSLLVVPHLEFRQASSGKGPSPLPILSEGTNAC